MFNNNHPSKNNTQRSGYVKMLTSTINYIGEIEPRNNTPSWLKPQMAFLLCGQISTKTTRPRRKSRRTDLISSMFFPLDSMYPIFYDTPHRLYAHDECTKTGSRPCHYNIGIVDVTNDHGDRLEED